MQTENTSFSKSKLYSLDQILLLSNGNTDFVRKMILLFIEHTPVAITQIKQALIQKDYNTIARIAHKIKPSINSLNINTIHEEIKILSKLINYNLTDIEIELLIQKLDITITNVISELKNEPFL